jgi:hypothetical protein
MGDKIWELQFYFYFLFFPLHALLRFLEFIIDGQDFHYSYSPSLWNMLTPIIYPRVFTSKGETCSKWALSSQIRYSASSCTFPLSLSRMVLVFEEAHCVSLWVMMRARQQIQSASYCKVFRHLIMDNHLPSSFLHTFLSTYRPF